MAGDISNNENNRVRQKPKHFSGKSLIRSFVRFVNRTERNVDVVWLNYQGNRVRYYTLSPGQHIDANTYVGHPWIFRDADTGDHLVVQSNEVFEMNRGWRPEDNIQPWRKIIYITVPVFSLKERCLQVIRSGIHKDRINELELPDTLKDEIYDKVESYERHGKRICASPNLPGPSESLAGQDNQS